MCHPPDLKHIPESIIGSFLDKFSPRFQFIGRQWIEKKEKRVRALLGGLTLLKRKVLFSTWAKSHHVILMADRLCLGTTVELSQFQTDHGHPLRGLPHMHWQGLGWWLLTISSHFILSLERTLISFCQINFSSFFIFPFISCLELPAHFSWVNNYQVCYT